MITVAPKLTLKQVLNATKSKKANLERSVWAAPNKRDIYLVERSAQSLLLISESIIEERGHCHIWLPAYFCQETLDWLKHEKLHIHFYPITEKLTPDQAQLKKLVLEKGVCDLLVQVHFFGKVTHVKKTAFLAKDVGAYFLQDCTHLLRPQKSLFKLGDMWIFSPHKHYSIPSGGVFYVNTGCSLTPKISKSYSTIVSRQSELVWLLKKLAQWLIPSFIQKRRLRRILHFEDQNDSHPRTDFTKKLPGKISLNELSQLDEQQAKEIEEKRIFNHRTLLEIVSNNPNIPSYKVIEYSKSPYYLSLKFSSHKLALEAFEKFRSYGYAPQTWPDLPKEVRSSNQFQIANNLRQTVVNLPVHQGLNYLREAKSALPSTNKIKLEVCSDGAQYEKTFRRIIFSNMLQENKYLEAKKKVEGKSAVQFLIKQEGETIGVMSVLLIKRLGVSLYRLNRGPLFVPEVINHLAPTLAALKALPSSLPGFGPKVIVAAPELRNSALTRLSLRKIGAIRVKESNADTSWVNLNYSLKDLRERLDSKWRNLLKSSEDSGLTVRFSHCPSDFEWLIEKYKSIMSEKDFQGIPVPMAKELFSLSEKSSSPYRVGIASFEGQKFAGVLIATHGTSATYLIGFNSEEGRKYQSNNLLLWEAIKDLKTLGFKSFDLGGLGIKTTPHIAHFKRGIGGDEFNFIGEYVLWSAW